VVSLFVTRTSSGSFDVVARHAEEQLDDYPFESTDGSVIQAGILIALPCGDLQTTQSPPSRRNLRETGRVAHRMDHR
jgi:hypothetical protein